ncbi:MAG: RNA methyltransferase [Candidatus Cloacimonadaceae bacterium]|jgi:tRNA (cytidine32/uridine32-2'-O)-methyltransferase
MNTPGCKAENIYIILVEPIYEGNVGAVARIMNNFSFANLRIVGSLPTKNDFYLAMHSTFILENAQVYDDLEAATADLDRVIAFSRRVGKLKPIDFDPKAMAQYASEVQDLKLGLVFGRETFGLTDAEADLCPLRCHIPANPAFPSINLAQAVAIACWELYSVKERRRAGQEVPLERPQMEYLHHYMMDVMESSGFFQDHESTNWDVFLRRMLMQLNPGKMMSWRFKQMFNRWHVLVTGKGKGFSHDNLE